MNVSVKVFLAALALSLMALPQANAGVPTAKACAQVFEEGKEESDVVNVGKHGFVIKKRKSTVERAEGKITVTGYFWHVIAGENDRIYYTIVVQKGQPYKATIERIDLGGLFEDKKNSVVNVGATMIAEIGGGLAGAIITEGLGGNAIGGEVGKALEKLALKLANAVQRKLIGNWTPGIPVILDGMANYFANQL